MAWRLFSAGLLAAVFLGTGNAAAQEMATGSRIRVQIVSIQQTTLSSELAANISNLPLRDGESFTKSQILAEFDCSILQTQLSKAEAAAEVARQTLKVSTRLAELNSISTLEVDQASAKVKETEAEVAMMKATVTKCSLKAPFAGRIANLHVEPYQYVTPGKPLMDILDTSRLEVRLIVPSHWLKWLRQDSRFTIRIEELGRSYPARVVRLGARIDPMSQTIPLTGMIDGVHKELLPGMSGWANFNKARQ
jgi:membrane fusion protein (multidrug efflux system)